MLLPHGRVFALALALATVQGPFGPFGPVAPVLAQTSGTAATSPDAESENALPTGQSQGEDEAGGPEGQDALAERFVVPDLPELRERPRAVVTQVPDGDTLRLADRRTVRLACIDAPDLSVSRPTTVPNEELREENFRAEDNAAAGKGNGKGPRKRVPDQYFAKEAKDALKGLALKRQVSLRAELVKKDRQGRIVADACLEDGTSLSAWLVGNGLAYVVHDPDYPKDYYAALAQLQAEAMADRRGFWAALLDTGAGNHTFVGNTETLLFYSNEDVRSQQIKPRQRMYFGTLLDAFSSGYAPANSREFWPTGE